MLDSQPFGIVCFFEDKEGHLGFVWHYGFCQTAGCHIVLTKDRKVFVENSNVANALDSVRKDESELCLDPTDDEQIERFIPPNVRVLDDVEVTTLIKELKS
ncbi:MAG: hypothetical protein RJA61_654 [Candidatus Parcubacteria bacterium]|jgi:hypothetical protein